MHSVTGFTMTAAVRVHGRRGRGGGLGVRRDDRRAPGRPGAADRRVLRGTALPGIPGRLTPVDVGGAKVGEAVLRPQAAVPGEPVAVGRPGTGRRRAPRLVGDAGK